MLRFLALLIILTTPASLNATINIRLGQVSLDEGLSQAEVSIIHQDSDGFLWFGTQQGLNLYDGHRVRVIHGPDNLLEIHQIYSLYEDSRKNLWVGTVPNRNFRLDKSTNTIKEIIPPFPEGREIMDSAFFDIKEDNDGIIWLATMRALFRYNPQSEQLTFAIDFEPTLKRPDIIRKLFAFDDHLLIATSKGLFAINLKVSATDQRPTIIKVPFTLGLPQFEPETSASETDDRLNVKGIIKDAEGNILLMTVEGLYAIPSQSLQRFLVDRQTDLTVRVLEPQLNIWQVIEESEFYWLATNEGLFKLVKGGSKQKIFAYSETPYQSVDDNIIAMTKDGEGNLWLGSRNDGAFKWTPNLDRFTFYQQDRNNKQSLSNNRVWSTKQDASGNIWVGTQNGLNRIAPKSHSVEQFMVNKDKKSVVSGSTVFDIEVQGDKLWLATAEGIGRFNTTSGMQDQPILSPEAQAIFSEAPTDLFFIDEQTLGIIQPKGLYTYNTSTGALDFSETTRNSGKIKQQLLRVVEQDQLDPDRLLISMVDQVVSYSISEGSYQVVHALPPSDAPRTMAQDVYQDAHHTWIAYPGFGIFIIDNETGNTIKNITSLDGLPDNSQFDFIPDQQGNLWVTSNSGLIYFNTQTLHFRVYDVNDGLATNEFNSGAALIAENGDFYLGTIKGLVSFTPEKLIPDNKQRKLHNHITQVSLMSREIPESFTPYIDSRWEIDHNDYGLKLQFSALSFTSPKKLRYKYWIEGSSKTSPQITKESELFLPKLQPGASTFKVAVIDYESGIESPPESLFLKVYPHPAFSWWAYMSYILFLFSIGFAIYWQRRKRQIALLAAHDILKTNEERLQLALTGSDSGLWDWRARDSKIFETRQNENDFHVGDYYRYEERLESIHDFDRERYDQAWHQFLSRKSKVFDIVYRWREKDGSYRWYRDLARITEFSPDGEPQRITGTYMDVTQTKLDRDKINQFSEAFQNTRDVVVVCDQAFIVQAANAALYRTTNFDEAKIINHSLNFLVEGEGQSSLVESIEAQLQQAGHWEGEANILRLYRQPLPVLINCNRFENEDGHKRYVFAITDISQQKQAEAKLRQLANYDQLTGLPNRALLMDRISHALDNAERNQKLIALFFVDLDRFKQINDSLGHDIGDLLLSNVANVLQQCTRQSDTVARLGGDEFVIMLEDISNVESVSRIAMMILEQMKTPFQLGQHQVSASPSIGIALYPDDGAESDILLKHADIAMYHAKNAGRNNFKFFTSEMNQVAQQRLRLENDIRAGIKNNEFILHYQPKISLKDNRILGFECLARWQKPNGRLIPPLEFIPLAEEIGLIIDITEQLIDQAMQTLQQWSHKGIQTQFALNLSARHLQQYNLVKFVAKKLAYYQVSPSSIEFELTESTIMENMERAVELLNDLNRQRIAISLDDFGTGYTSFQYLKDFPINALKIDRSFVKDIGKEPKDEAIIDSIIILANKLEILTVAEGVETEEQANYLRERGCPIAQGYLYSKPLPVDQALELISKNRASDKLKDSLFGKL